MKTESDLSLETIFSDISLEGEEFKLKSLTKKLRIKYDQVEKVNFYIYFDNAGFFARKKCDVYLKIFSKEQARISRVNLFYANKIESIVRVAKFLGGNAKVNYIMFLESLDESEAKVSLLEKQIDIFDKRFVFRRKVSIFLLSALSFGVFIFFVFTNQSLIKTWPAFLLIATTFLAWSASEWLDYYYIKKIKKLITILAQEQILS